ncbi:MAG: VWA domain-containing protein [Clostridiales bacterium]|nr:VWA domain-containing protein [Clostridiales bacterium]
MSNINFDNPWQLLLIIPLFAVAIVPFCIAVRKDNRNGHNITALVLHLFICLFFTLAISGMSYESVVTQTEVYVLADISYSAEHSLDDVQQKLNEVADKLPENSKMGVVCFGRNTQQISDMGGGVPDVRSATKVDRSATDIGAAIRYAGNLFDDAVIKRLIVITDGVETVASNNIVKIVNTLQNEGVYIDAVYLDDNLPDAVCEVQIDDVDFTQNAYKDKTESVRVMVRANTGDSDRTDGYVSLYRGEERISRVTASFYSGLNIVSLPLPTDSAGTFRYEVRVETAESAADYSTYNNSNYFTQTVTDKREVLFVGGSQADVAAGRKIYGDDGVTYITDVDKLPLSVEDMCRYDEIALSNFDVRKVQSWQMFLSSLGALVNDYGKTLSTYGDTFVQENDGTSEPLNMLQKLLPFNIGNPNQESRLFALVLDISTSMNFESRLNVAKSAAVGLLQSLNPTDTVMVVGYSGVVKLLLDPTYLTTVGVIADKIQNCEVENETNLSAALNHTYDLMPKRFYDRRVIVISDGLIPRTDEQNAVDAAIKISRDDIALSAITVYAKPDGLALFDCIVNNQYAASGVFLQNIQHESEVDIVISDLRADTREIVIEGGSYDVTVSRSSDPAVTGVSAVEAVNGFWYNSAKNTATTVMTVKYYRDRVTAFDVPLYMYYKYGKGRVASFMSNISGAWTSEWIDGSGGAAFLGNLPEANLPDECIDSPFVLDVEGAGSSTSVYVTASATLPDSTDFTVVLTDPYGLVDTKTLVLQSGRYCADFATDAPGTYSVRIEYAQGNLRYSTETEFSVSYYAEYDSFVGYNKACLYRLLSENGQILDLDKIETLENVNSEYTTYVFKFTLLLLVACVVLFVVDIIIRQLKWKDVTSFFKGLFGRRKHEK